MKEMRALLDSLCSSMKVDKEVQSKILSRIDNMSETMNKVSEKVDTIQLSNFEALGYCDHFFVMKNEG